MKSFLGDFFLGKATLFLGEAILFRLMYMPRNIESKDFWIISDWILDSFPE